MSDRRAIPPHSPPSPCVNICVMHKTRDLCVGCFRSLDEIASWGSMAPAAQREIINQLPARRQSLKRR
ncbi:DUF1289 domain-containing protein [Paracoccus homiensis]|uniref:DUF1289 domain-containing protein n=1 Tax=Paracoccus homiensis TaxID=364199 RepID=UPI00398C858D